jgi:hypothetical protein
MANTSRLLDELVMAFMSDIELENQRVAVEYAEALSAHRKQEEEEGGQIAGEPQPPKQLKADKAAIDAAVKDVYRRLFESYTTGSDPGITGVEVIDMPVPAKAPPPPVN